MTNRDLPHNYEAEQAVLGGLIIDPAAIHDTLDVLAPEDFHNPTHQEIYRAIVTLHGDRVGVDLVTIPAWLSEHGNLAHNIAYLLELVNVVPTSVNTRHYAEAVKSHALRRFVIAQAGLMASAAYDPDKTLDEIVGGAQAQLAAASDRTIRGGLVAARHGLSALYDRLNSPDPAVKITWPWVDLNQQLESLTTFDGTLVTLAARPGMGKTSALNDIARHVARQGQTVAYFNLEMSEEQLLTRMVSSMTGIDAGKIRQKTLRDDERKLLYTALGRLAELPIYIDDAPGQTVQSIAAKCHRQRLTSGPIGLVIVDYLQIMQSSGRHSNRNEEIGEISRGLVTLAKELACPVLAAAQLNRSVEARSDKRPVLSDLRDSGSIEQDSAAVVMLYRDGYYNPDTLSPNVAEFLIPKNRFGSTGVVELFWNGQSTTFRNLQQQKL